MSWEDVVPGSGKFVSLKEDGAHFVGVFLGEPLLQRVEQGGGKPPRKSYLFAVLLDGDEEASIWRAPVGAAVAVREALENGKLAGKASLQVFRHGESGDKNTTYEVGKPVKISPALVRKVAAVEIPDLSAVKAPDSKF